MHGGPCDTEFTGIAGETRATIQLNATVIKNRHVSCLRIEKPDGLVAVGIDAPKERAVWSAPACVEAGLWLVDTGQRRSAPAASSVAEDGAWQSANRKPA